MPRLLNKWNIGSHEVIAYPNGIEVKNQGMFFSGYDHEESLVDAIVDAQTIIQEFWDAVNAKKNEATPEDFIPLEFFYPEDINLNNFEGEFRESTIHKTTLGMGDSIQRQRYRKQKMEN